MYMLRYKFKEVADLQGGRQISKGGGGGGGRGANAPSPLNAALLYFNITGIIHMPPKKVN